MPKSVRNIVGPKVRWLRSQRELSQAQLAVRLQLAGLDYSRVSLAKIEAQIKKVCDAELFVIARVLKVSMEELFPAADRVKRHLSGRSREP
jgi:transcriptional regulator with XRE-family HTH domain